MAIPALDEVMAELEGLGTEQNRKVYPRHGATEPMFGVSYANINKIAKRLRGEHELGLALWGTGNHDARELACRIADPSSLTVTEVNDMVRDCDNYIVSVSLAGLIAGSDIAAGRSDAWRGRKSEWVAATGWSIASHLVQREDDSALAEEQALELLDEIEATIADRANRVRHEMNQFVISAGLREPLRARALQVAAAISPVDVDHGETSCVTPDAAAYIEKTVAHRVELAARRAAKKALR